MTDSPTWPACGSCSLRGRRLYPQFATHNALTVASVIEDGGRCRGYEFQRLHGMGDVLYDALRAEVPDARAGSMRRSAATAICSPSTHPQRRPLNP